MSADLTSATAAELAQLVASGRASAEEVALAHLDRIEATDEALHAFLHVDRDGALAAARAVDAPSCGGRAARPAGRRPAGAEGRVHHPRDPHDVRLTHPAGLGPALRRDGHHAPA